MRRFLVLLLLVFAMTSAWSADFSTERVFMYESPSGNAAFFDLSKTLYLPKYSSSWANGSYEGNSLNGTYSNVNYVGQLGYAFTDHDIVFEISTDGRFTSQSDPTKYREFYIALRPKVRAGSSETDQISYEGGGYETNYILGSGGSVVSSDDRLPNTSDEGYLSFQTQAFTVGNNKINVGPDTTLRYVSRFWFDVLVCMDELRPEDLQHLSENDDYIAKVYITWHCTDSDCTKTIHNGSFTMVMHGYYGSKSSSADSDLAMYVIPTADSMSLNLADIMASSSPEKKIADLNVYCTVNKAKDTSLNMLEHLFIFASSSPYYDSNTTGEFKMYGTNSSNGKSIPFTLVVKSKDGSSTVGTFDGTDVYPTTKSNSIDFSDYLQTAKGRMMESIFSVVMETDVYINFTSGYDLTYHPKDVYEGYIYYHIVTDL